MLQSEAWKLYLNLNRLYWKKAIELGKVEKLGRIREKSWKRFIRREQKGV